MDVKEIYHQKDSKFCPILADSNFQKLLTLLNASQKKAFKEVIMKIVDSFNAALSHEL